VATLAPRRSESAWHQFLGMEVVALVVAASLCLPLYYLTDGLSSDGRYRAALGYFLFAVVLAWLSPSLRGRNIGYPVRAISVIWFIVFGIGPWEYVQAGERYALEIVYSGGFSLLMLCCGYILGRILGNQHQVPAAALLHIDTRVMWLRMRIVFAISLVATAIFVAVGGIPALQPDALLSRLVVRDQVSSYVLFMLRAGQIPFYYALALYLCGALRKSPGRTQLLILMFFVTLFVNWIPAWRNPLMMIILTTMFVFSYSLTKISSFKLTMAAAMAILAMLVLGYLRLMRFAEVENSSTYNYFLANSSSEFEIFILFIVSQFSSYSYGYLNVLQIFPSRSPFLYGGVFLTSLATILPGKQEMLDDKLKRLAGANFEGGGLNLSLLGESYADFGWVGVMVYPFIYGVVLGWLMRRVELARTPARVVVAAFATTSICLGSLMGLLSLMNFWVLGAIIVWVALAERWSYRAAPAPVAGSGQPRA